MQTELKNIFLDLIHALQGLPVSRHLRSSHGSKNLLDNLSKLMSAVITNDFDILKVR